MLKGKIVQVVLSSGMSVVGEFEEEVEIAGTKFIQLGKPLSLGQMVQGGKVEMVWKVLLFEERCLIPTNSIQLFGVVNNILVSGYKNALVQMGKTKIVAPSGITGILNQGG